MYAAPKTFGRASEASNKYTVTLTVTPLSWWKQLAWFDGCVPCLWATCRSQVHMVTSPASDNTRIRWWLAAQVPIPVWAADNPCSHLLTLCFGIFEHQSAHLDCMRLEGHRVSLDHLFCLAAPDMYVGRHVLLPLCRMLLGNTCRTTAHCSVRPAAKSFMVFHGALSIIANKHGTFCSVTPCAPCL